MQINAVRSGTVLPHMEQDPHEGAMSHPSVTSSSQSQPLSRWSNAGNPGAPTSPITGTDPGSCSSAFFLVAMSTIVLHKGMHKLEKWLQGANAVVVFTVVFVRVYRYVV